MLSRLSRPLAVLSNRVVVSARSGHVLQSVVFSSPKPSTVPCNVRCIHATSALSGQVMPFKLSDIGEGIAEVQVKQWFVKAGDHVNEFDELCEVQSDKASVTITSRYKGVIQKLYHKVDDIALVGKPLLDIEVEGDLPDHEVPKADVPVAKPTSSSASLPSSSDTAFCPMEGMAKPLATPAVRRIAMENKIKLTEVPATGKDGRVLKEDILRHIGAIPQAASPAVSTPRPVIRALAEDKVVPIRGYTRAMVKVMQVAKDIPHFGYRDEVCMDRLVDLRKQLKHMAKEKHIKMSYMPLFIKAASLALSEFPVLNSSADDKMENLIYKASHNISLAIDTPGGLVVPNIKHCEQKNIWEIADDLNRLQELAQKEQISSNDLKDGTFTLSNIGAIGGTYAHPVIFPPQVAIGALGRMRLMPRVSPDDHKSIVPSHIVNVSWSADHRFIDGATMARFSNLWKKYLEQPATMIAQMR